MIFQTKSWRIRAAMIALAVSASAATSSIALQKESQGQILKGKRVAILVTDGFEQSEMADPRKALNEAGAKTTIVSPQSGQVRAWKNADWSDRFPVDLLLDEAKLDQFDALLLPGGVLSPDKLRTIPKAVSFVRGFVDGGKPVAAICHGPWTLVEADAVRGRRMTSWPSLKTDVKNAGGIWEDAEVIVDQRLITSRKPDDIPAFNRRMIEEFAKSGNKTGP